MRVLDFSPRSFTRFVLITATLFLGIGTTGAIFSAFLFINTTPSEPLGLYMYSSDRPKKGDFVLLRKEDCPIKAAWIPNQLLKHIRATTGDRVAVSSDGVYINGAFTGPRPLDDRLNPYNFVGTIAPGEAFLLAPHPRSFDSRHYGPVRLSVLRKAVPLWTF